MEWRKTYEETGSADFGYGLIEAPEGGYARIEIDAADFNLSKGTPSMISVM
ncbi:MAG: hypothetical protein QCH99_02930 [Candidatus Bathyarchaeota archaeon]|nr:hypothetical protein [Candidatus Bathyarchaeum tardum]